MNGFKIFLKVLGSIVAILLIGCLIAFFVVFLLGEQGCITTTEPSYYIIPDFTHIVF